MRLHTTIENSWRFAVDIFKPTWRDNFVSFKHRQKAWWVEDNGTISTKILPNLDSDRCLFQIENNTDDNILIRSKAFGKYICISSDNVLTLSDKPTPFKICTKVSFCFIIFIIFFL